jgi:hypothetical protein
MGKGKHRRSLGRAEWLGWGRVVEEPDDDFWGQPETDTPAMPIPLQCDSCHCLVEKAFHHASAPEVPLCATCYNFVANQHRPPSKRM